MLIDPLGLRELTPNESAFLSRYFGKCVSLNDISVHGRTFGDTGRAWNPFGGYVSLPKGYFTGGDPDNEIDFKNAHALSVFAHEVVHVWQRSQGIDVTGEGLRLQRRSGNPYSYPFSSDQNAMFNTFINGNIEQQGQMYQDYVYRSLEGGDTSPFGRIANICRCPN